MPTTDIRLPLPGGHQYSVPREPYETLLGRAAHAFRGVDRRLPVRMSNDTYMHLCRQSLVDLPQSDEQFEAVQRHRTVPFMGRIVECDDGDGDG